MAIHWQVKFKSLRADTLYTVNIYDSTYSGSPVQLTGGAQPFTTDEDDDDDFFAPVRTQSGYIRIVDTGKDNSGGTFNWRDLIPSTDTDRPVTLTNESGDVLWQGFMQAQNFSGSLYEVPQEREFPVQCALAVLSRQDIDAGLYKIPQTFASLLKYIIGTIPTISITRIMVQGGADARAWLLKKFDWMVFGETTDEGTYDSKYDVLQVLTDMCNYWGWSARTSGQTLWLLSPDDTTIPDFLSLTPSDLQSLAVGTSAGTIDSSDYTRLTIGDVFASTNNTDSQLRGPNHAELTSEVGQIDNKLVYCYPDSVMKTMYDAGFDGSSVLYDYTYDKTSFTTDLMTGTANSNGSFNILRLRANPSRDESTMPCLRCKAAYSGATFATMQSTRAHIYTDGHFKLTGKIYQGGEEFSDADQYPPYWGNKHMTMRFGIGLSRSSAVWWNGAGWSYSETTFYAKIGGNGDTLFTCKEKGAGKTVMNYIPTSGIVGSLSSVFCNGYIFIDFLGSDDISDDSTKRAIDIVDFAVTYERTDELWRYNDPDRHDSHTYKAKNDKVVKEEWTAGTVYATENYSKFGPGVVVNGDNSYFKGWDYANHQDAQVISIGLPGYQPINLNTPTAPEQHFVNRIASFWSQSHRKIECELLTTGTGGAVGQISPRFKITIDGTTLYPLAISRDWRDDVVGVVLMELPVNNN